MNSTPEQRQFAKELHAKGLTYGQIAYRLGFHKQTVRRWLDPGARQRALAYGRRYREANRDRLNRYARKYMRRQKKGNCPRCGEPVPKPGIKACSWCRAEERDSLRGEIESLWNEGLKLREIGERLDLDIQIVGHHVRRMREAGWNVPRRRAA